MAQYVLQCKKGGQKQDVVRNAGQAIGTDAVRVYVDDANVTNKHDVLKALAAVIEVLTQSKWPLV